MKPHEQRVVGELKELADKHDKLKEFIHASDLFQSLPADEKLRLQTQYDIMGQYMNVLQARIDNFPK